MSIAPCPYCGSDCFSEAVRADKVNTKKPERFSQVYGHWFNKCKDCEGWSLHKDGKQEKMSDKSSRPKKHSLPAV